jgi:cystathionine gamma-synthase
LAFLGETPAGIEQNTGSPLLDRAQSKAPVYSRNRHYSKKGATPTTAGATPHPTNIPETTGETVSGENLTPDLTTYLEERYGRNFPLFNAPLAKQAIKRRIVGGLLPSDEDFGKVEDVVRGAGVGGKVVVEDDVYLYPCGMSAIWHAFDICRKVRRASGGKEGKSVCYG